MSAEFDFDAQPVRHGVRSCRRGGLPSWVWLLIGAFVSIFLASFAIHIVLVALLLQTDVPAQVPTAPVTRHNRIAR